MAGLLSGISLGANLPTPRFRDGTEIPVLGNSNIPLPDTSFIGAALAPPAQVTPFDPASIEDLTPQQRDDRLQDVARTGQALQGRLRLLTDLSVATPALNSQLVALDAEIINLFAEFQALTDFSDSVLVNAAGEELSSRTRIPGQDRPFTTDELQRRLAGEEIGPEIYYVNSEGVESEPISSSERDAVGPDGEPLTRTVITPGEDRAFTSDELLRRSRGETIDDVVVFLDADGNEVEPVEETVRFGPNGERLTEQTIVPGEDRPFTADELLTRARGETISPITVFVDADGNEVEPIEGEFSDEIVRGPTGEILTQQLIVPGEDRAFTQDELLRRSQGETIPPELGYVDSRGNFVDPSDFLEEEEDTAPPPVDPNSVAGRLQASIDRANGALDEFA